MRFAVCSMVLVLAPACAAEPEDDVLDGEDDDFLVGGKADGDLEEGSAEACSILKLANLADMKTLDRDAKLNRRAAHSIIDATDSAGGFVGSLAELDKIKWVGPAAFKRLRAFASSHSEYACGTQSLQLLAFNDFHGNLKPPTGSSGRIQIGPDPNVDRVDAGGAEFMATHMLALAATNPNTLVVSAGDIIGATPLVSALFHDEPTIESVNLMGLDIAGVGNHEFDEGLAELHRMQYGGCHPVDGCQDGDGFRGADFEYLAANVTETATGETIFEPYAIRNVGNARVAFIGMTLEGTPLVTTQAGVAGLTFADEAATVNALVPELNKRGIHAIVVLLHEGGAATGLYNECVGVSGPVFQIVSQFDPAVDVVVSGHTNAAHICTIDNKLITSSAHAGRLITDIDLEIDERTGEIVTKAGANVIVTRTVAKDAAQTALIAKYDTLAAPLANRVVGRATGDLLRAVPPAIESPMGNLIADAQLANTRAAGAVAAFMNPGGVRTDILMSTISGGEMPGELTYGELFAVQPFGNNLITFDVTGAQIERMLEQQWSVSNGAEKANMLAVSAGFTYAFSPTRPIGDRIDPSSIKIDGVVVDPSATYRVTANAFLSAGGDGFAVLAQGGNRAPGAIDVDALEVYVHANSPLAPPAIGRLVVVP